MDSIDQVIEQANEGLSRISIVRRGRKLALRGSLPKRLGEGRGNKQTTIALGVFANPSGIKVALAKAQRLESDLNMERFTWTDWEKGEGSPGGKSAADWGKEYAAVKVAEVRASTYRKNYRERLESLPDKPLTEELLLSHVQQRSKINTKGRRDDCIAFGQLATFASLAVDFSGVKGRYEPKPLSPDDVPSDDEIEAIWASITNPGWKWVYGMLAAYGLRPHEVFKISNPKGIATETGKITILDDSKTGRRDVWPLPDKWRSQFNLTDVVFPKIRFEGRDNQQLGERVGANLCGSKDRKIPHRPYALRHAWAIRSAVMGVPDSIAARWMGHSVAVHAKTYHAAISQLQHEAIWRRANQLGNST